MWDDVRNYFSFMIIYLILAAHAHEKQNHGLHHTNVKQNYRADSFTVCCRRHHRRRRWLTTVMLLMRSCIRCARVRERERFVSDSLSLDIFGQLCTFNVREQCLYCAGRTHSPFVVHCTNTNTNAQARTHRFQTYSTVHKHKRAHGECVNKNGYGRQREWVSEWMREKECVCVTTWHRKTKNQNRNPYIVPCIHIQRDRNNKSHIHIAESARCLRVPFVQNVCACTLTGVCVCIGRTMCNNGKK